MTMKKLTNSGHSVALILPKEVVARLKYHPGDWVLIRVDEDEVLTITKVEVGRQRAKLTEVGKGVDDEPRDQG